MDHWHRRWEGAGKHGAEPTVVLVKPMDATVNKPHPAAVPSPPESEASGEDGGSFRRGSHWSVQPTSPELLLGTAQMLGLTRYGECYAVSRAFPSWNRSILTEIYLCHACSYHETEDGNARTGGAPPAAGAALRLPGQPPAPPGDARHADAGVAEGQPGTGAPSPAGCAPWPTTFHLSANVAVFHCSPDVID
jgi:hypothetical protein